MTAIGLLLLSARGFKKVRDGALGSVQELNKILKT